MSPPADDQEPVLTPKLDPRWALGPGHVLLTAFLAALFLLFDHVPLRATDLWCHVLYGQWIIDHRALPVSDPYCVAAGDTPVVASAWLSQVIFAAVQRAGGLEWLSHLFALVVLATYLVLARVFFLQSRSPLVALAGCLLVAGVGWSRLFTIRPENFGALSLALLLWLLVPWLPGMENGPRRPAGRVWLGVPLLMALWANLHGSFVCGLLVLGGLLAGRIIEVLWRTRRPGPVVADGVARRWLGLLLLATAATLLNPYGPGLLWHVATFSRNPVLRDILEWQPVWQAGTGHVEFWAALTLLPVFFALGRRPPAVAYVLLLGMFALMTLLGVRMAGWFALVYALAVVPQLAAWRDRRFPAREPLPPAPAAEEGEMVVPPGRSFYYTLFCVLLVWVAFALSPLSGPVFGREPRHPRQLLHSGTPVGLSQYLRAHPVSGTIFCPQWWGDWLAYAGPAGTRPFMTSNMHLIPPEVWGDYVAIGQAKEGWQERLARHDIAALAVDRQFQPALARAAQAAGWRVAYRDTTAMLLVR